MDKKKKFYIDCVNRMMEIAGYNTRHHHLQQLEALGLDKWYDKYTWTEAEESSFMAWYLLEAKKRFPHLPVKWLKLERGWFMLMYGLRTV